MPRLAKKMEEQLLAENPGLRDQGLVPVVLWLPDPEAADAAEEARMQSLNAAASPGELDAIRFIESAREWQKD